MHQPIAIVGSGGCTALSLLAEGAADVVAIDLNRTQNHLIELKAAVVAELSPHAATAMLGGAPTNPALRRRQYLRLRERLTPAARQYWDRRLDAIESGVLDSGATERAARAAVGLFTTGVHPRRRINELLALQSLDEQRNFFYEKWDTRRWRGLFKVLLNQRVMHRVYNPNFFTEVGKIDFGEHFRRLIENALTELPVRDNYFLHQLLTGSYPMDEPDGRPPYLASDQGEGTLTLIDGSFADYLRTRPDNSIGGFSLSNICEWLDARQIDELFGEVVRTALPHARLCFRNFVGWTDVPESVREHVIEDDELGTQLIRGDRSFSQRRFVVCDIDKEIA